MVDKNEEKLYLECSCGPHFAIELSRLDLYEDEPELFSLTFWIPCYYAYQGSIFRIVWKRIMLAWKILFKGEHNLHDILLEPKDVEKLKNYIAKF